MKLTFSQVFVYGWPAKSSLFMFSCKSVCGTMVRQQDEALCFLMFAFGTRLVWHLTCAEAAQQAQAE
jgi:hypothetical protein